MKPLSIVFLGARQAGCIGLLSLAGAGCRILGVVAYDGYVESLARTLGLKAFRSIEEAPFHRLLKRADLLVSVHGREIVPKELLSLPRLGGINVHPCLSRYPGPRPIERLLKGGGSKASVDVHRMTEKVDNGEVLVEESVKLSGERSVQEIYNVLYPTYATAILKAVRRIQRCELP